MSSTNLGTPKVFKRAIAAYERGDLPKAESLCAAALKSKGDYFDALHMLAVIKSRRGFAGAALALFDKALALRPNHADLLNNRASALTELKRYEEALSSYDYALKIRSNHADAHNNRGCVLMEMTRYEEAAASYGKALVLNPNNAEFANNLGRALTKLKRYEDALACYDDALALRPDYVEALVNRGVALNDMQRYNDAVICYDKALALDSDHFEALLNRGNSLNALGHFEEALGAYDRALGLQPGRSDIVLNRAAILTKLKRFDEALESYNKALALQVDPTEIFTSRALTLSEAGRLDEALASVDKALSFHPDHAEAHNVRGIILMRAERFDEAIGSYHRAVELRPDFPPAEWNLGYLLLLCGDFVNGWAKCEARRRSEGTIWTKLEGPEWRGEPLKGKRLLLYAEQGFGDAIQFARFVGVAAAKGAEVILGIHDPLVELLRTAKGQPTIVRHGEITPLYDFHLPLMSMPWVLGMEEKGIPSETPYLEADSDRVQAWESLLPQSTFRVGIAWQGSKTDSARWIPLAAFAPLSRVSGVTLISLQKTDGLDQLVDLPPGITIETLGPHFDAGSDAFLDTAAVMMNLDLIVSIDTGVAHLAGALGRPVWIVLKHVPDWRFMLGRDDSPWYPTARLFRRKKQGEWAEVMEEVAAELARLLGGRNNASGSSAHSAATEGEVSSPRHDVPAPVLAPISVGELIDKITILEIKATRVSDPHKCAEISKELSLLNKIDFWSDVCRQEIDRLKEELKKVNEVLWVIEDRIRDCEREQDFGPGFVQLARAVYKTNDQRTELKRRINELSASVLSEIKAYSAF